MVAFMKMRCATKFPYWDKQVKHMYNKQQKIKVQQIIPQTVFFFLCPTHFHRGLLKTGYSTTLQSCLSSCH